MCHGIIKYSGHIKLPRCTRLFCALRDIRPCTERLQVTIAEPLVSLLLIYDWGANRTACMILANKLHYSVPEVACLMPL